MKREYLDDIPRYATVYTIEEWHTAINSGMITDWDGRGYWCKNGLESDDDPFETEQEDATHVAWYNK